MQKPGTHNYVGFVENVETCVLVNKDLCGNLVLSLEPPTTFDESFKGTSLALF